MEYGNVAQWIALGVSLITVVWQAVSLKSKAATEKVMKLEEALADKASSGRMGSTEERVSRMDTRLSQIENELRHLPSRDQTHKMEIALEQMSGQIKVMSERLAPVAATSERLQEFLLSEAKGRRGAA